MGASPLRLSHRRANQPRHASMHGYSFEWCALHFHWSRRLMLMRPCFSVQKVRLPLPTLFGHRKVVSQARVITQFDSSCILASRCVYLYRHWMMKLTPKPSQALGDVQRLFYCTSGRSHLRHTEYFPSLDLAQGLVHTDRTKGIGRILFERVAALLSAIQAADVYPGTRTLFPI